jgi:hypothetical protein
MFSACSLCSLHGMIALQIEAVKLQKSLEDLNHGVVEDLVFRNLVLHLQKSV